MSDTLVQAKCDVIKLEDWNKTLKLVDDQLRQIMKSKKPAHMVKIHCKCGRYIKLIYLHRCLYCQIWICAECAEEHFGQSVEAYRKTHPIEAHSNATS